LTSTRNIPVPQEQTSHARTSLLFLVPFFGLLWDAVCHVYAWAFVYGFSPFFAILILVPLGGALAALRGGRVGFLISAVISLQFFLVEGPFGGLAATAWASVTVPVYFVIYLTVVPALFLAFVYSVAGTLKAFLSPARLERLRGIPKTIPFSALLVILAVGFIIGGASIGAIAAHTESSIASVSHAPPDITIALGASSQSNAQFYSPTNYTVTVGSTVTWVNQDTVTHTVTENNGLFDSGPLPPGTSFSYTFTQTGSYSYSCAYHPWMVGMIIVTSK